MQRSWKITEQRSMRSIVWKASALCYLVAFDLDRFDLAYALGTEHPAVDWSDHIQPGIKNPKLPGPDGIGNISPLVSTGLISPENARRTVATFTGGFKRDPWSLQVWRVRFEELRHPLRVSGKWRGLQQASAGLGDDYCARRTDRYR